MYFYIPFDSKCEASSEVDLSRRAKSSKFKTAKSMDGINSARDATKK